MNRDFGGDHGDMARAYYGPCEPDCEPSYAQIVRETERIERDYHRYQRDRVEGLSHQELVDCGDYLQADIEGFRMRFELIDKEYRKARAA